MGLTSMTTVNEGIKLCVFDLRRGQHEDQELDKILYFYPSERPYSVQLSVIGLCEGIITFTRIFSPEAACEVIEAEWHSHVFYEAEPDIWMVLVVEKNKDTESVWRCDALREILKEMHSLFLMFHGSIRVLLEKQPSGELARNHLNTFVVDYLTDFHNGKEVLMPSFRDCLRERGTVQMLTVSREIALEVQSLITLIGSSTVGNMVCNSLVLFQDLLVSTTLSPDDTAKMYTYGVRRLTPHALSSNTSSWSYLRWVTSAGYASAGSNLPDAAYAAEVSQHTSRDTSPGGQRQRYYSPRTLQRDRWSKGKDGFVVTDIWGTNVTPMVWLQQVEEKAFLCVYQHRNLTVILLIPIDLLLNGEPGIALAKKQFLENASPKILHIEERLSRGCGGENAYHDSLLSLNKLREEVDMAKSRARCDNPEHERDFEICIRAKNNAWLIANITRGKELYMVLEKADDTLLYASDAVEKFSNRYCDGAFSLD